jgi:hypothetical protein
MGDVLRLKTSATIAPLGERRQPGKGFRRDLPKFDGFRRRFGNAALLGLAAGMPLE